MYNREKFIECVYDAGRRGLRYPKFGVFQPIHLCKPIEVATLYDLLEKSGNTYIDETGKRRIINAGNSKDETFELNICLIMISLIVNTRFQKSEIKFENRLKAYCCKSDYNHREVFIFFYEYLKSMRWASWTKLQKIFYIIREVIKQTGEFDMLQLFEDLLDWKKDQSIGERWVLAKPIY